MKIEFSTDNGYDHSSIIDYNGNKVGTWKI